MFLNSILIAASLFDFAGARLPIRKNETLTFNKAKSAKDMAMISTAPPLVERIAQLEEQAQAIAQERAAIIAKSLAEIEAEEKEKREILEAINAQADADFYREKIKDEHFDVFSTSITPSEMLYRFAVTNINRRDEDEELWPTHMWYKWHLKNFPQLPRDTRSMSEKLLAYAMARKAEEIPHTPEVLQFEDLFADALRGWFKGSSF